MKVERFCSTNVSYPEPYIKFTYSPLLFPEYITKVERIFDNNWLFVLGGRFLVLTWIPFHFRMKVERFCSTNVSYPEPYIKFTYSPLLFPEHIMKVERIFDNTTSYFFLAEVSCESLFKIIWYIKSNKSEYQTNKFIFRMHLYLILYYRSRFF